MKPLQLRVSKKFIALVFLFQILAIALYYLAYLLSGNGFELVKAVVSTVSFAFAAALLIQTLRKKNTPND